MPTASLQHSAPKGHAATRRMRAPSGDRTSRVGKGLAAFLLGLMLGISGIVLGQSAFHEDDTSPPVQLELRR
jgi:hypothetical protein